MSDNKSMFLLASDISVNQKKSNDLFLYVEMRMQSTRPNGNGEGVTEAFIDSVVNNQELYNCQPLYVDLECLLAQKYQSLGHLFDKETGTFGTQQIGSMCSFRKVSDEYGYSLVGEARIPKRDWDICEAVIELFELGMLSFSFEIFYYPSDTITQDGVRYVDASERNVLRGMCIVSVPAYRESVALDMVAEEEKKEESEVLENDLDEPEEINDDLHDHENEEGVENMNIDEAMGLVAERDQTISDLQNQVTVAEERATTAETALNEANVSLENANNTIVQLNERISELELAKAELDEIKAEQAAAELVKKQEKAKAFAEKQGLDVTNEDVAKAIAEMNYEAIADLAAAAEKAEEKPSETIASFFGNGIDVKENNTYGDLLERRA